MNTWSCARKRQGMNCLLWKEASSVTMPCQTIRSAKRVHCSYQEPRLKHSTRSGIPSLLSLRVLAKALMGGRSRTQAAHQMFLGNFLSSITQWDTAPNSTDRWDRILHRAPGGTTQEDTKSSLLQLQTTG